MSQSKPEDDSSQGKSRENAILLDDNWEAYWIDKDFGYMLRCVVHKEPRQECSCPWPSTASWKKLIFLDQLAKI